MTMTQEQGQLDRKIDDILFGIGLACLALLSGMIIIGEEHPVLIFCFGITPIILQLIIQYIDKKIKT